MAEQTLKEFVVSLGWQGQDSDHEKFSKVLEAATLRAELLAKGIEATVKALLGGANQTAAAYDKLYYAAERMHTTVAQIQALQYALGQVGGSAEEALATMETVAGLYQKDHGNLPYLQHIGFDIDKKTGQLKWTLETLKAHGLLEENDAQSSLWADNLHISQATMMRFKQHPYDIDKFFKEKIESDKRIGLDPDEGAKKADDFEAAMGRFIMIVQGLYDKFKLSAQSSLTHPLELFNDFLRDNAPLITNVLEKFANAAKKVTDQLKRMFEVWIKDPTTQEQINDFFQNLIDGISFFLCFVAKIGRFYREWYSDPSKTDEMALPGKRVDNPRRPDSQGLHEGGYSGLGKAIGDMIVGPHEGRDEGVIKSDNMKVGTGNALPVKFDELEDEPEVGGNFITRAFNSMKAALLGSRGGGGGDGGGDGGGGIDPSAPGIAGDGKGQGPWHGSTLEAQQSMAGTRRGLLDARLREAYDYASEKTGLIPRIQSGGQRMPGAPGATGSHRHDDGRAGDYLLFDKQGRVVSPTDPRALEFYEHMGAAGATGGDAGYMGDPNLAHSDLYNLYHHPGDERSGQGFRDAVERGIKRRKEFQEERARRLREKTSRLYGPASRAFAMRGHRALTARLPQPKIYNQDVIVHVDGSQDPSTVGHIVGRHVAQLADEMTKRHKRTVG